MDGRTWEYVFLRVSVMLEWPNRIEMAVSSLTNQALLLEEDRSQENQPKSEVMRISLLLSYRNPPPVKLPLT
jgi:hypothetical protein